MSQPTAKLRLMNGDWASLGGWAVISGAARLDSRASASCLGEVAIYQQSPGLIAFRMLKSSALESSFDS